jgi:hypothetical protein
MLGCSRAVGAAIAPGELRRTQNWIGGTRPGNARYAARHLESLGIVRESTGRRRNKLYVYTKYLEILQEGTQEEPG